MEAQASYQAPGRRRVRHSGPSTRSTAGIRAYPEPKRHDYGRFHRNSSSYRARVPQTRHAGIQRRRRRPRISKKTLVLLAAFFVVGGIGLLPSPFGAAGTPGAGTGLLPSDAPASTPSSDWKKGEMPYLYQTDEAWASQRYAGGTIATHGCGPAALSMIEVYLKGSKARGPVDMCRFSENNGFIDSGLTSWQLMSEGARKLGLTSRELSASDDAIRAQLRMGHPVICIVGPGDFTTTGHFIVISAEHMDDTVEIRDPNSKARSEKPWELSRILSQCQNIWAFSV